ncbi:MAG TPA: hypothetical protein VNV62_18670 [Trebonia sp.]|jgi:hypothetical protein|nr:hypothetical protein [Trebonia sp.]
MTQASELETADRAQAPMITVPVMAEGQDLSGGHQGVDFTMVVSTAVNPVVQLLPRDYDRLEARILTIDEPVVLATSREMAESPANAVNAAGLPAVGSVLPVGIDRVRRNCDEVWVAATSATPTRVSVSVSRRLPVARPVLP